MEEIGSHVDSQGYNTPKAVMRGIRMEEEMELNDLCEELDNDLINKYINLEDELNSEIYELFTNEDFILLLEKYDIFNNEGCILGLDNELKGNDKNVVIYNSLLRIKSYYSELILIFNELNSNEVNKKILMERIKYNDLKLIESSKLNNPIMSSDNNNFRSNDYFKLLLLDLRILKRSLILNDDILLEKDMIIDMLNRNRIYSFTLRMNDLLRRHIEDVDVLNKKDEDSFYLESVLRKKVNLIHIENRQLKEQRTRDQFLINKKDHEIYKLSSTLFSLQDQLDESICNLRIRLKNRYGNKIYSENLSLNSFEDIDNYRKYKSENIQLRELDESNERININDNNLNMIMNKYNRNNYINTNILKDGAKLLRINENNNMDIRKSEITCNNMNNTFVSKLNIFAQCKHVVKSSNSTPRTNNRNNLIITPLETENIFVEKVSDNNQEEFLLENIDICKEKLVNNDIANYKNNLDKDLNKSIDNLEISNNNDTDVKEINLNDNKKIHQRVNLPLKNYKSTERKSQKIGIENKNIQENERSNISSTSKLDIKDTKSSKNSSKEIVNECKESKESKISLNSTKSLLNNNLSKKRTKSNERLNDNSIAKNNLNSKSSQYNIKNSISDDFDFNESSETAKVLSRRNLKKVSGDMDLMVSKVKNTNLTNNSTFNISNNKLINKYLSDNYQIIDDTHIKKKDKLILDNRNHDINNNNMPVVKAYKATIQNIRSINEFQSLQDKSKKSDEIKNNETESYIMYSPEIKPLDLQPVNFKNYNLNSHNDIKSRSNTAPLINNVQQYSYPSNYNHYNSTPQYSPSHLNSNNIQYIAPIPTPITVDATHQRILFPNGFHALYK